MRARATTQLALSALLRNRMRSLLTMLGVVIGVAAVLMMESLGEGATAYVSDTISGLGSNMLMVVPGSSQRMMGSSSLSSPLFTTQDVEAVRRGAHDLGMLSPVGSRILRLVVGANNRNTSVIGVSPEYFAIRGWGVTRGRALSREDERQGAQVCVIGHTIETSLFPGEEPVGRELRVHELSCRVIGVLETKGASAFGTDQDDIVFMPFTTFSRRVLGSERVSVLIASATDPDRIDAAKDQITSILRHQRHILPGEEDDFGVRDPRELQAVLSRVTGILTAFLLGVAGISLLVGGIGIMNIMLVSVTERTREIGIRLAVGARSGDILRQFLVESVALSGAGGLIGIALGMLGAFFLARGLHVPYVVPAAAMPVAFGVALLVGVTFGVVPARKAATLHPLAALRHE